MEAEVDFLVVVLGLLVLDAAKVLAFTVVEVVDRRLEGGPDGLVLFTRNGTNGLPYFEQFVELAAYFVPLTSGCRLLRSELGGLFNKGLFGKEVLLHLGTALFEVFAMTGADLVGSITETGPNLVVVLCGDGSYLAPLLTQRLHIFESFGDRRFDNEFFGTFAQLNLLFEVLLHVEHLQFAIDFDFLEELAYIEVVGLPEIVDTLARHVANSFPAILKSVEFVVTLLDGVIRVDQFTQLIDDLLFLAEVLLFASIDFFLMFLTAFTVLIVESAERLCHHIVLGLVFVFVATFGNKLFEGCLAHFSVGGVEGIADAGHTVLDLGDVA